MSKRAYESAALTGFEVTVPVPAAPDKAPASGSPEGMDEDSWYRTLRVMSGAPADDVERAGALDAADAAAQADPAPSAPPPVPSILVAPRPIASAPLATPPSEAPAPSGDSYEDSWYQILKSRRAAAEAD